MNDDFEPEYEEDDDDGLEDLKQAKEKGEEAYDKYRQYRDTKASKQSGSQSKQNLDNQKAQNNARDFDKSMQAKNQARTQNPEAARATSQAAQATGNAATTGATTGATTAGAATTGAATSGAAATGATATAGAATGATATAGAAAGATATVGAAVGTTVAEVAAGPVGWILLAIEAIRLAVKGIKKHDKKMAEKGIDSKSIRRLILISPILIPIALIVLILIILMQGEAIDKTNFMEQALTCFETNGGSAGCVDFMNTKIHMGNMLGNTSSPLIRKTDTQIATFIVQYLKAENKIYGKAGSLFSIREIVDDISSGDLLDPEVKFEDVAKIFDQLVLGGAVTGAANDVQAAWYMFKWMKMEKKIFNEIVWSEASLNTNGISWLSDALQNGAIKLLKVDPKTELEKAVTLQDVKWYEISGFDFNINTSWLEKPSYVDIDEAVQLTREYIPSFMEVYATYIATGDYKMADEVYKYYVNNCKKDKPFELKIRTYQTMLVDVEERAETGKDYRYYKITNGSSTQITKAEYDDLKDQIQNKKGLWNTLKNLWDDIKALFDVIDAVIDNAAEWIKNNIGWYTKIERENILIIEKGAAYNYKSSNKYRFDLEEYEVTAKSAEEHKDEDTSSTYELEQKISDSKTIKTKIQLKAVLITKYDKTHKIYQNRLAPQSSNSNKIDEYEHTNRYIEVLYKIEEQSREAKEKNDKAEVYTVDSAAMAVDLVDNYYKQTYGLIAGATASDFVQAGTLNESIVKYAEQFVGYKLANMKQVDDLGIFWDDEWCAMFVSFCMKKANVSVPKFAGCSTFWRKNNTKPGFFDVAGANNGGYVTSEAKHRANLNQVQPGDILLFRWNSASAGVARSHTGICQAIEKDAAGNVTKITTIEGNTGGSAYYNSKVSIGVYTGGSLKSIVSFVSVSTVMAEAEKGNMW